MSLNRYAKSLDEGALPDVFVKPNSIDDLIQTVLAYSDEKTVVLPKNSEFKVTDGKEVLVPSNSHIIFRHGAKLSDYRTTGRGTIAGMIKNEHYGSATRDTGIIIENPYCYGRRTIKEGGFGITMENTDHSKLLRCHMKDIDADGIHINGTPAGATTTGTSEDFEVTGFSENSGVDGFALDFVTNPKVDVESDTHGNRRDSVNGHGCTLNRCHDGYAKVIAHDGVTGATADIMATGLCVNGCYRMTIDGISYNNNGHGARIVTATDEPIYNIIKLIAYNNTLVGLYGSSLKHSVLDLVLRENVNGGLYFATWCIDNDVGIRARLNANGIIELSSSDYNTYHGSTRNNTGANTIGANSNVAALIT